MAHKRDFRIWVNLNLEIRKLEKMSWKRFFYSQRWPTYIFIFSAINLVYFSEIAMSIGIREGASPLAEFIKICGDFGCLICGVGSFIAIFLLYNTLKEQKRNTDLLNEQNRIANRTEQFKLHCQAIDEGLAVVTTSASPPIYQGRQGLNLFVTVRGLIDRGQLKHDALFSIIAPADIQRVANGLIELIGWIGKSSFHFEMHTLYRIRYMQFGGINRNDD